MVEKYTDVIKNSQGSELIEISEEESLCYYYAARDLLDGQMVAEDYEHAMMTAEKVLFLAQTPYSCGRAITDFLICASRCGYTTITEYFNSGSKIKNLRIPGGLPKEITKCVHMYDKSFPFAVNLLRLLMAVLLASAIFLFFQPELAILLSGADGLNAIYIAIGAVMVVSALSFNIWIAAAITGATAIPLLAISYILPIEMIRRFSPSIGLLIAAVAGYFGYCKMKKYQKEIYDAYEHAEKIVIYGKKLVENARHGKETATINQPEYIDKYCDILGEEISYVEEHLAKYKK